MKTLKYFFLIIDITVIIYWSITALHLIPAEYLYNDYKNPMLVNWNWSFFPLDILIPITGLYSVYLDKRKNQKWIPYAFISLILTSISGLQAISYWYLAKDYELSWWLPNLFLLIYPLFFIPKLIGQFGQNDIGDQKRQQAT
jgi:hypothetical protein